MKEEIELFAKYVLSLMEQEKEWSADTLDDIANLARNMDLAELDQDGNFKSKVDW